MKYKKIKDVVVFNKNSLSSKNNLKYINYLDTSNITKGKIDNIIKLDIDKIPSRAKRIVKNKDIVYSTVRPNLCHYGLLENVYENMVVSTGFVVISCTEEVLPEYLYGYLTLNSVTQKLVAIAETTTSTYPSIKPNDIGELEIPIFDIEIQKKFSIMLNSINNKIIENTATNDNLCYVT